MLPINPLKEDIQMRKNLDKVLRQIGGMTDSGVPQTKKNYMISVDDSLAMYARKAAFEVWDPNTPVLTEEERKLFRKAK
jgi:hypothetical protein